MALKAFAGFDENKPGIWFYGEEADRKLLSKTNSLNKVNRNPLELSEKEISDINNQVSFEKLFELLAPSPLILEDANRDLRSYEPIRYDIEKILIFWEWWLTQAIPQAWELAEKSVANQNNLP